MQRKNVRLDLEDLLSGFVEEGLGVVDGLEGFLVAFLLGEVAVLFEHVDHLLDAADDAVGLGLDFLDVRDGFHHVHQEVFVLVVVSFGRVLQDALGSVVDELTEVLQGGAELVLQEGREHVDPGEDLGVQGVLQRLEGNLQPSDLDGRVDALDFVLNVAEVGDLLVEQLERRDLALGTLQ